LIAIYDNSRRTRRAILSCARKSGKTALAAALVLVHLCGPRARPNSRLYSTAMSREQAALIFDMAAKIIRMTPWLQGHVVIRESAKTLVCPELGTVYRALSAEASTAHGLSPAFVVHDELGQVRGPRSRLFTALETATAAQPNPLSVIISTQAPTDADLLSVMIDDAKAGTDPRVVLQLHTAPPELDAFSMAAVGAANPALEMFMNKTEVMAMLEDARRMPALQAEYENLVLNRRVEANSLFVQPGLWKECGGEVVDIADGRECFAGLDLSAADALTALVIIGRENGTWHVVPRFWLPGQGIHDRARRDHVPYDQWAAEGHLELTPTNSVSYEYVARQLFEIFGKYNVRRCAFDRWGFRFLKPELHKAGFSEQVLAERWVEFGQGTQSMSPALRVLEEHILEGQLRHGEHPVLSMCAANAVVDGKDPANRKLSKKKSNGRIDGMVALTMAIGVAPSYTPIDIESLIG
jgi:phage terminase large subunit-like protein